jgi:hypothetical protein
LIELRKEIKDKHIFIFKKNAVQNMSKGEKNSKIKIYYGSLIKGKMTER